MAAGDRSPGTTDGTWTGDVRSHAGCEEARGYQPNAIVVCFGIRASMLVRAVSSRPLPGTLIPACFEVDDFAEVMPRYAVRLENLCPTGA